MRCCRAASSGSWGSASTAPSAWPKGRTLSPHSACSWPRATEVGRNQLVVGVSVPLPVLDSNRGNQLQALRLADQAEEQLLATRVQLQAQLFEARELLQSSREQARQLAEEVLPTARTAYELASRGFALGKFAYLDVLDAQRTWSEARSQYLDQLLATHRAAADIDRLLGTEAGL